MVSTWITIVAHSVINTLRQVVNKYNLAGVASWEKDRETNNVWTIIQEGLKK